MVRSLGTGKLLATCFDVLQRAEEAHDLTSPGMSEGSPGALPYEQDEVHSLVPECPKEYRCHMRPRDLGQFTGAASTV
jgi:hypothetical protein